MNQEQNNLNPNNFNTQGNNGIPNNQNVTINQQPTPQSMNTFESGNISNPSFNNKPPKKINIGLIIGVVAIVAVVGLGVAFGGKLFSNNGNDNNAGNNSNIEQEENDNTTENEDSKIVKASTYFDTSKFDKSKYSGLLYGYSGNSYKVSDFINNIGYNYDYNNQINVIVDRFGYSFSSDYQAEKSAWDSSGANSSDAYIYKIIEVLGHPSTYCENYYEGDQGVTGNFDLIYNYDEYLIVFPGLDMRNWKDYDYKYPNIVGSWIYKTDDFYSDWNLGNVIKDYTCYGEQLQRD